MQSTKLISIFIASSEELKPERDMLAIVANDLTTSLSKVGYFINAVRWEGLDASMPMEHKQKDYNDKLRQCDMCIVLYWTKFGMYTKSELDTAVNAMRRGENPRKVYIYFKNEDADHVITDELRNFRDTMSTEYGHFYTPFSNTDTLKAHFLLQFIEYQSHIFKQQNIVEVKDGRIYVGNTEYIKLKNVPFAGNNEDYNSLVNDIKELELDLADMNPSTRRYLQKAEIYQQKKERLANMESSLWDTAFLITKLYTSKCSERLERAIALFNAGDNKGAQAILNEKEIDNDIEHNLRLIKLGEEGKKGFTDCIKQYCLRIKTLQNSYTNSHEEVCLLYEKVIELSRNRISARWFYDILWGYIDYLYEQNIYSTKLEFCDELLDFIQNTFDLESEYGKSCIAEALSYIAEMHTNLYIYDKAEEEYKKAISVCNDLVDDFSQNYVHRLTICLNGLAYLKMDLDDYKAAKELLKKSLCLQEESYQMSHEETFATSLSECMGDYANILRVEGNLLESISMGEKSLAILPKKDYNQRSLAISYQNLGISYCYISNYPKSVELLKKSVNTFRDLYKESPNSIRIDFANSLTYLATSLYLTEDFEQSLKCANEAIELIEIQEKINPGVHSLLLVDAIAEKSRNYIALCMFKKANISLAEIISYLRDRLKNDMSIVVQHELANLLVINSHVHRLYLKSANEAINEMNEAINFYTLLAQHMPKIYDVRLAEYLIQVIPLRVLSHDGSRGEDEGLKAIEILEQVGIHTDPYNITLMSYCYLNLGELYQKVLSNSNKAMDYLLKAQLMSQNSIDLSGTHTRKSKVFNTTLYCNLGNTYYSLGKIHEANKTFQLALDSVDVSRISLQEIELYISYSLFLLRCHQHEEALSFAHLALNKNKEYETYLEDKSVLHNEIQSLLEECMNVHQN